MNDVLTKKDLADQNLDKVFPHGLSEADEPSQVSTAMVTMRPGFGGSAVELESAKMMSMAGPLVPEFLRNNPGHCWGVIQLSKRWSRYDERTNSWISFDPIAIASCMYLVEGKQGPTVGYNSQFVGALVDAFTSAQLRFIFDGEGQELTCTCIGTLKGDKQPFEYTTPPLRTITPKRSPLWESDPKRQLSYYARRAWARLFTPGVLLGVFDVDELEGNIVHRVRDLNTVNAADGLHERLARAVAQNQGDREGFSGEVSNEMPASRPAQPVGEPEQDDVLPPSRPRKARASGPGKADRTVKVSAARGMSPPEKTSRPKEAARRPEPATPLPTNVKEYRKYVTAWLPSLDTEETIEARWRTEMKLRNFCGVVEEDRAAIRLLVDARIQQLRQAR